MYAQMKVALRILAFLDPPVLLAGAGFPWCLRAERAACQRLISFALRRLGSHESRPVARFVRKLCANREASVGYPFMLHYTSHMARRRGLPKSAPVPVNLPHQTFRPPAVVPGCDDISVKQVAMRTLATCLVWSEPALTQTRSRANHSIAADGKSQDR